MVDSVILQSRVRILAIPSNDITGDTAKCLKKLMKSAKSLHELVLCIWAIYEMFVAGNALGDIGCQSVLEPLIDHNRLLKVLMLGKFF